ncbi:MAG TPA: TatD family hydrolase [Bacteroidota bacterium]
MYIDSHAHLFNDDFRNDLPEVLSRAQDAGVRTIVVPGTTLETSYEALELAEKYPFIYACVGFHPHEASKATEQSFNEIEQLSKHEKVVAIGEIGLDFHYDFSPRATQEAVFKRQVEIAVSRNLPIVVHTRESMSQAIRIVMEAAQKYPNWKMGATPQGAVDAARGVFHCFTGKADEALQLFELGFFVSYPGIVTFKNSPVLETLRAIGYKKILIETDSPYLAPVPLRGKRNEPAHIVYVANRIAEQFSVEPSEIGRTTAENTRRLFGISS